MQSFLQYRCFRKQFADQTARDHVPAASRPIITDETTFRTQCTTREEVEDLAHRGPGYGCPHESRPSDMPQRQISHETIHGGDVERADIEVEISGTLSMINTQETMGNSVGINVTGVEMRTDTYPFDKLFVVLFEGDNDPTDPRNWTLRKRLLCTLIMSLTGAAIEYSTVVDSRALEQAVEGFGNSDAKQYLVTGIFLIGMGIGSVIAGPFSEILGRNPVYIVTMAIKMLFSMGASLEKIGVGKNLDGRIICRFFGGFFGSASLICTSAAVSDIWTRRDRVLMFPFYACLVFIAPLLAATFNSIIVHYRSGRYVHWTNIAVVGFPWILVLLFLPETYIPVLLQWKAMHLRKLTGDARYKAPIELKKISFLKRLSHALCRPLILILKERLITVLAAYMSLTYIILFVLFGGFPYIFSQKYGLSAISVGLSFLACIGGVLLCVPAVFISWRRYKNDTARTSSPQCSAPEPEASLRLALFGAPAIPLSLFLIGWTAQYGVTPAVLFIGASIFGYGAICVVISIFQYVTDTFECYTASAQAAVIMPRYIAAGLMSEVTVPLYKRIGVGWMLTLVGLLSLAMTPVPYVLCKYGAWIRKHSAFLGPSPRTSCHVFA